MSWSGGKDSAMALHELLHDDEHEVVALLTSVSKEFRRIAHHGVKDRTPNQRGSGPDTLYGYQPPSLRFGVLSTGLWSLTFVVSTVAFDVRSALSAFPSNRGRP